MQGCGNSKISTCPGTSKLVHRNFQLVLDEMGPCPTSRAWYFHSPVVMHRQIYSHIDYSAHLRFLQLKKIHSALLLIRPEFFY